MSYGGFSYRPGRDRSRSPPRYDRYERDHYDRYNDRDRYDRHDRGYGDRYSDRRPREEVKEPIKEPEIKPVAKPKPKKCILPLTWDENTKCKELRGHNSKVHSVAWNSNGKMLASGSTDRTARVWFIEKLVIALIPCYLE
jgi:hypothetical protein